MTADFPNASPAPIWNLYGEAQAFPDVMHIERISDRAAGLDWVIAPHRHVHLHQFFLLTSGEVRFAADGEVMRLSAPFVLSVPAGVIHGFTFSARAEGMVLTIPIPSLPDVLGPASAFAGQLAQVTYMVASGSMVQIFIAIYQEYNAANLGRSLLLRALAVQVIATFARALPVDEIGKVQASDSRVSAFESLLQTHLREGWRVQDFAAALSMSARHLSRLCQAARGVPATKLIEAAILREGCRMLVYTRMPVALVAYELGFDDPSYFSRVFRRAFGQTPNAYRSRFEKG